MLAALLTPVLFSLSVVCGHRSAKLIGGTEANFWRLTFASLFLAAWAQTAGGGLSGASFPLFLASGLVGIGIGDVAFFQALPRLGSRLSLLLIECLAPPFGALIEWAWVGTAMSAVQVGCGSLILVGVALALGKPGSEESRREGSAAGAWLCVVAALATAAGAVLSRVAYKAAQTAGESPDAMTAAYQRVLGGLLVGGLCLLFVKRRVLEVQRGASREVIVETSLRKWRGVWLWIVLNSLMGQTLGVTCMQAALRDLPTGIVLAIIAVTPIVVIPLAYVVEGERPTRSSLIGGVIAVFGVIALVLSR